MHKPAMGDRTGAGVGAARSRRRGGGGASEGHSSATLVCARSNDPVQTAARRRWRGGGGGGAGVSNPTLHAAEYVCRQTNAEADASCGDWRALLLLLYIAMLKILFSEVCTNMLAFRIMHNIAGV